ncbi:hypothetical protein ABZU25_28745 [Micromonospora sp. NPDC005215]|uniref:P-loop ATPase, Sll1717 family n=1 Tax=Micromonospora sp. NPDC005215 TaxID=3157024 RepID=UPI0033B8D703
MIELHTAEHFGAVDADADELLRACFQDHEAYTRAREFRSFLILGRKGSGKTAIYRRFVLERSHDVFSFGHSFEDYPWHHHDLQAQIGVPEERRFIHSWKYLILMSLAKVVLNQDQSQPWSLEAMDDLVALQEFVVDSYGSRDPDLSQLFSPDKELRFKSTFKAPFLQVVGERVRVRELPAHVQEVNRAIQDRLLSGLNPDNSYYVCFDQLDLGFSKTDPLYAHRLIGLVLAARELFLAAKELGKKLNVIVFLRDDIYQDLQFEDKNKVTQNYTSTVQWEDFGAGLTLQQLMESRFSAVLSTEEERKIAWADVFDDQEMPNRQPKYKHICDRTFLRPRDMIQFCNEILYAYKLQGASDGNKFDNPSIHGARGRYSDYLLAELDDEIAKHVPNYKDILEVLKSLGTERFSMNDFVVKWDAKYSEQTGGGVDALERMFEFSVVGYLKPGGRSGGSEYVWRYRDPRARFDSTAEVFRVHPGFKEALGISR